MRFYHTGAPDSRLAQGRLHPKTQFTVHGDTLRRTINDNARLLVQYPKTALAVPVDTLLEAERRGVRWLLLTDEHGKQYRTALDAFWKAPAFDIDRGYGKQRALPLDAMTNPEQPQQAALFEVYA